MTNVGIVDFGMGNLKSIYNALDYIGVTATHCVCAQDIEACDRLIVPGVGAYRAAMENLRSLRLVEPIRAYASGGRPLLGICLGMQLLSTLGSEPDPTEGLDLIPGEVMPLPNDPLHRVPHVGWNAAQLTRQHPLFAGIKPGLDWYFVHSYYYLPAAAEDAAAMTDYGVEFASIVARRNVLGVQFHPEKSQEHGLRLLENFTTWDGTC